MGDEQNTGSMLGKFGGIIGKGAAKAGKKAAQSEAGKRATSAAVKGACDGVRDDLTARYGSPTSPTAPSFPAPAEVQSPTKPNPAPSQTFDDDSYEEQRTSHYSSYSSSAPAKPAVKRSTGRPPKPSFFNRLNFMKKDPGGKAPPRRVQRDPRDKIYSNRLAKTPDWDRLPLAQTLYNFKGEMKCDLEFRKGQVIQIMTRTDTQEDWWEGRLEGRVGIFPANYVKLL